MKFILNPSRGVLAKYSHTIKSASQGTVTDADLKFWIVDFYIGLSSN